MNERGQRNGPFQRERERTANKLASWPAGWIEEGCSCGDCVCLLRPYWEEEWCRRQQQQEEKGERRRMSFRARARGRGGVVSAFLRARARTEVPTKNECEWSWSSGEDAVPLTFFPFPQLCGWVCVYLWHKIRGISTEGQGAKQANKRQNKCCAS